MTRIFKILAAVLLISNVYTPMHANAQVPDKLSYQAVIRDSNDDLVPNKQVGMRISILRGSSTGALVYSETQIPTTNVNGLISIEIGGGSDFSTIDWANDNYFIKTETDLTGGTNYTIIGTSQLLSVPYALNAKTAENISGTITELDPRVPTGTTPGQMQYWNGSEWVIVASGNEGEILTFISGVPTWSGTVSGNDVINPITGETWMDRNLGSSQQATAFDDYLAYGSLFQWGRSSDGHENINWTSSTAGTPESGTTSTLSSTDIPGHSDFILSMVIPWDWRSPQNSTLWQGVNGINNPCPTGYRIPTEAELDAERLSWTTGDYNGAYASPLKFVAAGYRLGNFGWLSDVGSYGAYWTSTVDGFYTRILLFHSGTAWMSSNYRGDGYSVRCIKD